MGKETRVQLRKKEKRHASIEGKKWVSHVCQAHDYMKDKVIGFYRVEPIIPKPTNPKKNDQKPKNQKDPKNQKNKQLDNASTK